MQPGWTLVNPAQQQALPVGGNAKGLPNIQTDKEKKIQMKAIVLKGFGGTENFFLEEVEEPKLIDGTVKVKIKAAAFNPIDYQMRKGGTESKLLRTPILGREMSGVVEEVHHTVTDFKIGDEIYSYVSSLGSNGTYAEYIIVPTEIIALKPKNITFEQATAMALVGLTAIQTIEKANLKEDSLVFITGGAGGVGSMLIRLLLQKGIKNIFTTAGNKESIEQIISYGLAAERILDYKETNLTEKILGLTANRMFTHCLDTVGNYLSTLCAEIIAVDGYYADITFMMTDSARELIFDKAVTTINVSNYAYGIERDKTKMKYYNRNLSILKEYIESAVLTTTPINILGQLSVDTVSKAHQILENNQTKGRKLVMQIG
ncbi:MAG: NADP-dependent oxidoreductase [Chitinophagaceae bacterium]|nr:NADP-dependent oxidoreductase [Chitinophagaceae bacterium]